MAQSTKVINKGKVHRICTLSWKLSHGLDSAAADNKEFKHVAGIKENAQHVVHLLYEFEVYNQYHALFMLLPCIFFCSVD